MTGHAKAHVPIPELVNITARRSGRGRKSKEVNQVNRIVSNIIVKVQSAPFLYGITIWPPLQIRVIKPVKIIVQPGIRIPFLAGKAIAICRGQAAVLREHVPKRIVQVFCRQRAVWVQQASHIAVAIRMIKSRCKCAPCNPLPHVRPGQQPANPAGSLQFSA